MGVPTVEAMFGIGLVKAEDDEEDLYAMVMMHYCSFQRLLLMNCSLSNGDICHLCRSMAKMRRKHLQSLRHRLRHNRTTGSCRVYIPKLPMVSSMPVDRCGVPTRLRDKVSLIAGQPSTLQQQAHQQHQQQQQQYQYDTPQQQAHQQQAAHVTQAKPEEDDDDDFDIQLDIPQPAAQFRPEAEDVSTKQCKCIVQLAQMCCASLIATLTIAIATHAKSLPCQV